MVLTNEQKATRRAFRKHYGATTENVVKRLMRGHPTRKVATDLNLTKMSVAAYAANLSRGTYADYVINGCY